MITKNEERVLRRALHSVRDIAYEMIVVDTGSTDNTMAVAKECGAKTFFFQWNDHFADARNCSMDHATGDWILILDADEELYAPDREKLLRLIRNPEVDMIHVLLRNLLPCPETQTNESLKGIEKYRHTANHLPRLLRNKPFIRYHRRIHEDIPPEAVPPAHRTISDISIYHYGYCYQDDRKERRATRNEHLTQLFVKENPDDPTAHFYVGTTRLAAGRIEEAERELKEVLRCARPENDTYLHFRVMALFHLARNAAGRSDYAAAEKYSVEAILLAPEYLDAWLRVGEAFFHQGKYWMAERAFHRYLKLLRDYRKGPKKTRYTLYQLGMEHMACFYLGRLAEFRFDWDRAKQLYQRSLELDSQHGGAVTHFHLASLYARERNYHKMDFHLAQARQLDPKTLESLLQKPITVPAFDKSEMNGSPKRDENDPPDPTAVHAAKLAFRMPAGKTTGPRTTDRKKVWECGSMEVWEGKTAGPRDQKKCGSMGVWECGSGKPQDHGPRTTDHGPRTTDQSTIPQSHGGPRTSRQSAIGNRQSPLGNRHPHTPTLPHSHTPTLPHSHTPTLFWYGPFLEFGDWAEGSRYLLEAASAGNLDIYLQTTDEADPNLPLSSSGAQRLQKLMGREKPSPHSYVRLWDIPPARVPSPDPQARWNIARMDWPTDRLPQGWQEKLKGFDQLWVPSRHHRKILTDAGVPAANIRLLPGAVDTRMFSPERELRPLPLEGLKAFNFLAVFDWNETSAWKLMLRTYLSAFRPEEDISLILKPDLPPGVNTPQVEAAIVAYLQGQGLDLVKSPNIISLAHRLNSEQMAMLYRVADAFVLCGHGAASSPHYLEAMAMGLPIIATCWGAHLDYLDSSNAYLVNVERIEPLNPEAQGERPDCKGHHWAVPSEAHLKETLRKVAGDPAAARAVGRLARETAVRELDTRVAVARMIENLRTLSRDTVSSGA